MNDAICSLSPFEKLLKLVDSIVFKIVCGVCVFFNATLLIYFPRTLT